MPLTPWFTLVPVLCCSWFSWVRGGIPGTSEKACSSLKASSAFASNIGNVIQPFGLQTAQNTIALLTSFFAIFLYFNIGMKTVYLEVFQEIFNFPAITTRKGQWCWYALGPVDSNGQTKCLY
ncbi:hypothetical protein KC355_g9061 [Hortaea werneckii]|nr:hypothetical protein KC355_g9061 [Hortaea werneckii]